MKLKNILIILGVIWIILILLIISEILGIYTYEETRYVFYVLIVLNAIISFNALKKINNRW